MLLNDDRYKILIIIASQKCRKLNVVKTVLCRKSRFSNFL